jgi:hypothetical protein
MTNVDPVGSTQRQSSEPEKSATNIYKPARAVAVVQQVESGSQGASPDQLSTTLRQISKISISEVGQLIKELQILQRRLETDGDRIERDIQAYSTLSQQVTEITSIITDSVKKLPTSPGIIP